MWASCPAVSEATPGDSADLRWVLRDEPGERSALDAWCWGVGPPVYQPQPASFETDGESTGLDSLAVVVWNAHVGHGDLAQLIRDLRSGRLTGSPVEHFVLLLQEVQRTGPAVPREIPGWVATAGRIGGDGNGTPADITSLASQQGLSLLYAPSMRNGRAFGGAMAEDRGNAILSTLPLEGPLLFELPWERQRRVAVIARISGLTSAGTPWSLQLASAHLDNRARIARIHRSFGTARKRQAQALATLLADGGATVLGADLNTWLGEADAEAALALHRVLPVPATVPDEPTAFLPRPLPDRVLDYMLFRIPETWSAGYHVADGAYGSDHRLLMGWVDFTASVRAESPPNAAPGGSAGRETR